MLDSTQKRGDLNYLPYITSTNFLTGQINKLLIDTGANKNVIRPGILTKITPTKNTKIRNIAGNHQINRKGKANLIDNKFPAQAYYELSFHEFFDGIIGSEYLAKHKAKINYEKESLEIANTEIAYEKYFPAKKLFSHTIQISTTKDGEWLVPTFQKLSKSMLIEPGLYNSYRKKSTVLVLSHKKAITPM